MDKRIGKAWEMVEDAKDLCQEVVWDLENDNPEDYIPDQIKIEDLYHAAANLIQISDILFKYKKLEEAQ